LRCSACGERKADFVVSGATPPDKPLGAATARAAGGRLIAVSTSAVLAGGSGVTRVYGRRRGSAVAGGTTAASSCAQYVRVTPVNSRNVPRGEGPPSGNHPTKSPPNWSENSADGLPAINLIAASCSGAPPSTSHEIKRQRLRVCHPAGPPTPAFARLWRLAGRPSLFGQCQRLILPQNQPLDTIYNL